jgi:hypothetical protein
MTFKSFGWIVFIITVFVMGGHLYNGGCENRSLKQQLEQANAQIAELKAEGGRPINAVDLPDGTWTRVNDKEHYAFVQSMCDFPVGAVGPVIAVYCDKDVPYTFAVKDIRKQVKKFLQENPSADKK